jgi:hypothetical protein
VKNGDIGPRGWNRKPIFSLTQTRGCFINPI